MARSRVRRVLAGIGIGLLVLVVLAGAALAYLWSQVPRDDVSALPVGSLTVQESAQGSFEVGPLTVDVGDAAVTVSGDGRVLWRSDPGRAFLAAGAGRVTMAEYRGYFWPTTTRDATMPDQVVATARQERDALVLAGQLAGEAGSATWSLRISPDVVDGTTRARLEAQAAGAAGNPGPTSLALVSGRSVDAGVHGFGEQFAPFDLDGTLLPILVREQGVGRGEQPITALADLTNRGAGGDRTFTYAAWPTFVTDELRGVALDPDATESHAFALADMTVPTAVSLESWVPQGRPRISAVAFAGDTPKQLLAARGAGVTRPPLADWTLSGAILGLQGGTDEVRAEVAAMQAAGTPIAAVWLQDWTGQRTTSFGERLWWTWQLDEERYPGWRQLVADLATEGIRTTTYVNTWLVDAEPKGDRAIRNLWQEARDAGHLVADAGGEPYLMDQGGFDASLVDLTDPAARDWFATVIAEEVLADGVVGFMADFGEGAPFDGVYHEGTGDLVHNRWPALWAQTVRQACDLAGQPECVAWFRSGALGQESAAPLFWNGDQLVTFPPQDGLASALLGTFSAGVSGWPLVHSDVGGYTSANAVVRDYVRTPDLLARWAEYEAFGVVMRTHEGNRPAQNLQVSSTPETAATFARMARLHEALADYRRGVVADATRTGVPAIRHSWVNHPGTAAARRDTQFFLGDSLLVAPVLGADEAVRVVLPPGSWVHLLTGESFEGDREITVSAPIGTPAAFVAADDPVGAQLRRAVAEAGLASS